MHFVGNQQALKAGHPECPYFKKPCPLLTISEVLGNNIYENLVQFIWTAKTGSRATLQHAREGFTIQVTDAVEGTVREAIEPGRMFELAAGNLSDKKLP